MFKTLNKYGICGFNISDNIKIRFILNENMILTIRIIKDGFNIVNYQKYIKNSIHFENFIKKFVSDLTYREYFRISGEKYDNDLSYIIAKI
jgi:hypothetical protein